MYLAGVFGIDQDVIQIDHNKDIKLVSKDLVDIALKTGGCVEKTEEYYLILEVAVSGAEGRLLLVTFLDSHPMIGTSEIQLSKPLGLA